MTRLTENVAAISAVFHQDERYQKFYDTHGDKFSGFPGIWQYISKMAEQFTKAEYPGCWEKHEWIDAIDGFVNALYKAEESLSLREARKAAYDAIIDA